jgi:type IV pilus biogenesis protein CpaD/CtpE
MAGGSPAASTTKTGRHDIAKNIAESGIKHQKIKTKSPVSSI